MESQNMEYNRYTFDFCAFLFKDQNAKNVFIVLL